MHHLDHLYHISNDSWDKEPLELGCERANTFNKYKGGNYSFIS